MKNKIAHIDRMSKEELQIRTQPDYWIEKYKDSGEAYGLEMMKNFAPSYQMRLDRINN